MEQVYSHHHMAQVHHHGLIIGTLVGSCVVTLFVAVAVVIASPQILLHPLSLTTAISVQPETSPTELGSAATTANNHLLSTQGFYGSAAQTVSQFSHR